MIIQSIMKRKVITATRKTMIKEALNIMEQNRIRHLPVVNDKNEIIGILSDRDLRDASPSVFGGNNEEVLAKPVGDIMITDVITALPIDFVDEAANVMTENQISCLPVEEDGKLVGIITEKDLLDTFVKLTGVDIPSSRLEVEVANKSGMLSEVAWVVKQYQINIQSVFIYPSEDHAKKILVFRLQSMDIRSLVSTLKDKEYTILWPKDLE
ncbi:acetoin utilization protein AcuB [Evansella caseinilytica]|uniref:Acetoin utilization protein AcuB n=1 Tax=Evansella caseinilytica TaxID=1503961 RepID=A0A1H3RTJ3_9BACI|nr:CBS and ACT domain-containing protein [Evansella caseinilytica]SDZ28635.1 acetoin utilization protein AcuB [Evansella caseinilytica]